MRATCPSHAIIPNFITNILRTVQFMKLLGMRLHFPTSLFSYFSPEQAYPVLRLPQAVPVRYRQDTTQHNTTQLHLPQSMYCQGHRLGQSENRVPAETRFLSSQSHQTGSGAHSASCSKNTGFISQRQKGRDMKLTVLLHLVPRLRMSGATPLRYMRSWHGKRRHCL